MTSQLVLIFEQPVDDANAAELERFSRRVGRLAGLSGPVDILITGSRRVQELNRRFRKKNKPTDVLSFPRPGDSGGDIAISAEIAGENAARYGHTAGEEVKILILHGMLHLAGYDHEGDNGEMAARENAFRSRLGLPNGLISRTEHNRGRSLSGQRKKK